MYSFNTVNGKYCCNDKLDALIGLTDGFNTVNGKYCCNAFASYNTEAYDRFNTVNGKYCCNSGSQKASIHGAQNQVLENLTP